MSRPQSLPIASRPEERCSQQVRSASNSLPLSCRRSRPTAWFICTRLKKGREGSKLIEDKPLRKKETRARRDSSAAACRFSAVISEEIRNDLVPKKGLEPPHPC